MRRVTRAEAVALTRSQLLDAAAEVFGEKGFAGASLDEIAERAGRTKGAVYSNFASKDDLFIAVLDQWLAASHQALEARLASISDADSLVEALRETTTVWARRSRAEFLLLWEFRLYALRNPEVADRLAKHERLAHEMCERLNPGLERRAEILVAAPVQHDCARGVRVARKLGRETRLPDSGLAGDQRELPFAAARRVESGLEPRALGRAADECPAREVGEPR